MCSEAIKSGAFTFELLSDFETSKIQTRSFPTCVLLKESLVHGINLLIVTSLVIEIESKYVSATRKKIKYRISTLHSFKCVGLRFNLCYKLEHNSYKQKRLLCNRINRSDRYRYPMSLKKSRHVAFEYSFIWLLEHDTPEWRDIAGFTRVCCIAEQQSNRDKSVSLFHWFDL